MNPIARMNIRIMLRTASVAAPADLLNEVMDGVADCHFDG